jgi:general secretion pathway protein I
VIYSPSLAKKARGFSLLEMVVAVAILGMSLGALYQAAGGATRIVAMDEKMAYGVELARSLVAIYQVVPLAGMSETGETEGGFAWKVITEPAELPEETPLAEGLLQHISVVVTWRDGGRDRKVALESVVAGREEIE